MVDTSLYPLQHSQIHSDYSIFFKAQIITMFMKNVATEAAENNHL